MAREYRSREGEVSSLDTKTQLTTLGSESSPGPLRVPAGKKVLTGILVAVAADYAAAGTAGILIRLGGPGLPDGPETICLAGLGGNSTTGINAGQPAKFYPIGATVRPTEEIQIFAEMVFQDVGSIAVGVTLVFD